MSSSTDDVHAINQLYQQFDYFDSQPNDCIFSEHLPSNIGDACGIVWCTIIFTINFSLNASALGDTQF